MDVMDVTSRCSLGAQRACTVTVAVSTTSLSHSPGFSQEVQAATIIPFAPLSPRGLQHRRPQVRLGDLFASEPL